MHLASKIFGLSAVESGLHKKPDNFRMSHFLETPVGAVDAASNHSKPAALELACELVILRIERFFIKSAKFGKSFSVHKHEHACRKRMVKTGKSLYEIIAGVQQVVDPASIPAPDICRDAVQRLSFDSVRCAA